MSIGRDVSSPITLRRKAFNICENDACSVIILVKLNEQSNISRFNIYLEHDSLDGGAQEVLDGGGGD